MSDIAKDIRATLDLFRAQGEKRQDPTSGLEYSVVTFQTEKMGTVEIEVPSHRFREPSAEFEKQYGLKGLSQRYLLPEGITAPELEAYVMLMNYRSDIPRAVFEEKIAETWDTLVTLNPELKTLKYNDPHMPYFMIHGVASAFAVRDIRFFVSLREKDRFPGLEMSNSKGYKKLSDAFNKAAEQMQWAAAPATLRMIEQQLQKKQAEARRNTSERKIPGRKHGP